jgi:hypothetical protein
MIGLNKHFGTDASIDATTQTEISQWLIRNSATRQKYSALAPDNRITNSAWFIHEHDEVKADIWKRIGVKSTGKCQACHSDAATGSFSENNIRIPAK